MKYIHFILITFSLIVILKCQKEITVSCTDSPKTLKLLDSQSFIASCPQNCGGGFYGERIFILLTLLSARPGFIPVCWIEKKAAV